MLFGSRGAEQDQLLLSEQRNSQGKKNKLTPHHSRATQNKGKEEEAFKTFLFSSKLKTTNPLEP